MSIIKIEHHMPIHIAQQLNIHFDHVASVYKVYSSDGHHVGKIISDQDNSFNRLSTQQVYNMVGMDYKKYLATVFEIVGTYALAELERIKF